jgi:hypothetical protein
MKFRLILAAALLSLPVASAFASTDRVGELRAKAWRFDQRGAVAVMRTPYAPVVYFAPKHSKRILVLAFGYPWDEVPDSKILSYAKQNVREWEAFARQNGVLIVAPVLGGTNFLDYRTLSGRLIDPDVFVNAIIDGPAQHLVPQSQGKFCIHGHSAGAQFAVRYVIAQPHRVQCAVLSAPSTYAMPNPAIPWAFGMGQAPGARAAPSATSWVAAASEAPIDVIVGSKDREPRPDAPGQVGRTRFDRGRAWVGAMNRLAQSAHKASQVHFIEVPGLDHNEPLMAVAARKLLRQEYLTEDMKK